MLAWLPPACALAGCEKKFDPADGAAPPAQVIETGNASLVTVDNPEQFPLVAAERVDEPDAAERHRRGLSRYLPRGPGHLAGQRPRRRHQARLDDNVKKGQLLLKVQSPDITNAFDTYLKAVNDEQLANKAYVRAKDLYEHGAISQAMLEQAEDAEDDAKADLTAAEEQLEDARRGQGPPVAAS